jgi:uncharacterized protein YqkB
MKKIIGIIAIAFLSTTLFAQKSIDALFEKYGGKEGFVTVTINGNLLKLAAALNEDDESAIPENITLIRILAEEDEYKGKIENFYNLVIKDIDISKYEEFMTIKESNQDVRMLVRTEGNRFSEFLLIVGGEDNALIQIKGNMTLNEAKKFANDAKKENGINILNNKD